MKPFNQLLPGDEIFRIKDFYKVDDKKDTPLEHKKIDSIIVKNDDLIFNESEANSRFNFARIPNKERSKFSYRTDEAVYFSDGTLADEELAQVVIRRIKYHEDRQKAIDGEIQHLRMKYYKILNPKPCK